MSENITSPTETQATEVAPNSGMSENGFIETLDNIFDQIDNPSPPAVESTPEVDTSFSEAPEQTEPLSDQEPEYNPTADLDALEEPKDWTPQAARRFKELKAELKEFRARASELEQIAAQKDSQLQELGALANNEEYQELKHKIGEYEKHMMVTQLENSSIYKQQIEMPLRALMYEADSVAQKYSINTEKLIDAIAQSDESIQEEALSELLHEVSDRDKFKIYKIIENVQPILANRINILNNIQEAMYEAQMLQQEQHQQYLVQRYEERVAAANAVASKIASKLPFIQAIDGLDLGAIAQESAQMDPTVLDPVTGTYQAMAAKLLPQLAKQYMVMQKEIDVLTDRLAAYDRATPRAGGGSLNTAGTPTAADGKSFLDAVTAAFGG